MRIGVLTSSYPRYPGDHAGVFVRSLTEHLRKLGHEPVILAPYEPAVLPDVTQPHLEHFRYLPVPSWHQLGYGLALDNDRRLRRRAYALIPCYLAGAAAALVRLARRVRLDILHCHWAIPNGPVAALVSALTHIPLVITLHGSDVYVAERLAPAGVLARLALRRAAAITACSADLAQGAVRLGAAPERVVTLPWGVDLGLFGAGDGAGWRRRHAIPRAAPVVLAAGRLVEKKGIEHLLRAAPRVLARYPETVFTVIGEGPLLEPLQELARTLGLAPAVRFAGRVPWEEMPDALHAADLFAAPSVRDRDGNLDGLPTVILEAMGAGLPVVASNLAGIPLVVGHGENGLLVPPGNTEALANALIQVIGNRELRAEMGRSSRQRVEEGLTWTAVAGRFIDLFEAAQKGKP
ncbi:MAG: glycosyltransferase family 4 protein [Chloroflexi bacterium]|nr:glycosyltransferase family 4 protein [Chloroflexota bacterium]